MINEIGRYCSVILLRVAISQLQETLLTSNEYFMQISRRRALAFLCNYFSKKKVWKRASNREFPGRPYN